MCEHISAKQRTLHTAHLYLTLKIESVIFLIVLFHSSIFFFAYPPPTSLGKHQGVPKPAEIYNASPVLGLLWTPTSMLISPGPTTPTPWQRRPSSGCTSTSGGAKVKK